MSEWSDRKKRFYRDIVTHGVTNVKELSRIYPLGWNLEDERLRSWFEKFHRSPKKIPYTGPPRLLNHFKQGADPEFILYDAMTCERVHATSLRMRTGRAFGADNNGRLVEIRPWADKSQLSVTASILATMRWMAISVPQTRSLSWLAGAYFQGDGLGGHVHIGKKRPLEWGNQNSLRRIPERDREIGALDAFARACISLGMYPSKEIIDRQRGDTHGQRYGLYGDIRIQAHGYEYRTLPSWLDSPWLTFFTLTMTKLFAHDPDIAEPRTKDLEQHLKGVLQYFRGLDDDARLALWVLERKGLPKHEGNDFKGRWGIAKYDALKYPPVEYIPDSIVPGAEDIEELFRYFVDEVPLRTGVVPIPTWGVLAPPKGYRMVLDDIDTHGQKGLGEILKDIVIYQEHAPSIGCHRDFKGELIALHRGLQTSYVSKNISKLIPKEHYYIGDGCNCHINFSDSARHPENYGLVRKYLTSGAFPVWKIADVQPDSYEKWAASELETTTKVVSRPKLYGRVDFEVRGNQ